MCVCVLWSVGEDASGRVCGSVQDDMRVKRVFLAAMFCCYVSISRLMQIRSVLGGLF